MYYIELVLSLNAKKNPVYVSIKWSLPIILDRARQWSVNRVFLLVRVVHMTLHFVAADDQKLTCCADRARNLSGREAPVIQWYQVLTAPHDLGQLRCSVVATFFTQWGEWGSASREPLPKPPPWQTHWFISQITVIVTLSLRFIFMYSELKYFIKVRFRLSLFVNEINKNHNSRILSIV